MQRLDRLVLADMEACHVREPIAAVIASDRYIAEDAVDDIEVEYEAQSQYVKIDKQAWAISRRTEVRMCAHAQSF